MLLKSLDGSAFEASIVGYEFPEIEHDQWDSNWLLISMRVKSARGAGADVGPGLTTWEVERLIRWLESLAKRDAARPDIRFTEPNLAFEVIQAAEDALALRVRFVLESKARWKPVGGKRYRSSTWRDYVDLELSREDVRLAAEAWRADLSRFPVRTWE